MKARHFIDNSPPISNSGGCEIPRKLTSNIFSTFFVTWIDPLLKLGSKRPLDTLDLGPIPNSFEVAPLTEKLSSSFQNHAEKHSNKLKSENKPNILLKALISVFGTTFLLEALFLIGEFTNMLPPLILKTLIEFSKTNEVPSIFKGIVGPDNYFVFASLLMFSIQVFTTFSLNTYFMISRYLGIKIRTSVSGLVYKKALRLSCAARQVIKWINTNLFNFLEIFFW